MSAPPAASLVDWGKLAADFDRLNRILIPKTKQQKERFQRSRTARFIRRFTAYLERFSDEGQVFFLLSFLGGFAAMDVIRTQLYVAWAATGSLVASSWVVSWFFSLPGVEVRVTPPRRVTVGEEACLSVVVHNGGARPQASLRVRGAFLPWDGTWTARGAGIPLLEPGASERVELRARFWTRGAHTLDPVDVRALVPLGLTLGRPASSPPVRVLVVPRVAKVSGLALPQARRSRSGSAPRAAQTADARELASVRPYRIGDPVRDLHARTWARVGVPVVREYREEQMAQVGIFLDTDLGDGSTRLFEAAVSLCAGIAARLGRGETRVHVIVCGTTLHGSARPVGNLDNVLEVLARTDPEGPLDTALLKSHLRPHLARLSSLVIVTTRWDDDRRELAAWVEHAGPSAPVYVVGDAGGNREERGLRHVDPEAILRGEGLRL